MGEYAGNTAFRFGRDSYFIELKNVFLEKDISVLFGAMFLPSVSRTSRNDTRGKDDKYSKHISRLFIVLSVSTVTTRFSTIPTILQF